VLGVTVLALIASGCAIVRVSVSSGGAEGSKASSTVLGVSDDGRYSLYLSDADNLVPGDTNLASDVFRHDAVTGQTVRVNVGPNGAQALNGSYDAAMSADGRYVAFVSVDHLDPAAPDFGAAYVRDLSANTTTWVSQPPAAGLPQGGVHDVAISADGRFVSFLWRTFTTLPVAPTTLYRRDRQAGTTAQLSEGGYIFGMHASSDGRHFVLQPTCLQGGCFPVPRLIDTDGTANGWPPLAWGHCTFSGVDAISATGRFLVWWSAGGLLPPCLGAGTFLVDRATGTATLLANRGPLSIGGQGVSRDGTAVLFGADGAFLPGGTAGRRDLYLRDLARNTDTRVGVSFSGAEPNADIVGAILSDDGHQTAFTTDASNLVANDRNGVSDVFVRPALP
jgi:hypothetical protein